MDTQLSPNIDVIVQINYPYITNLTRYIPKKRTSYAQLSFRLFWIKFMRSSKRVTNRDFFDYKFYYFLLIVAEYYDEYDKRQLFTKLIPNKTKYLINSNNKYSLFENYYYPLIKQLSSECKCPPIIGYKWSYPQKLVHTRTHKHQNNYIHNIFWIPILI